MADARRIIFGSHIIPQEYDEREESIGNKYIILQQDTSGDAVAKTLGGKSTVSTSDIQAVQWSDTWVSFAHQDMNWEDWGDTDNDTGNRWEDVYEAWDGALPIGTSAVQLTLGSAEATDKDLAFVYVKNTGGTYNVYISCTAGGGAGFDIVIPPNGSVQFRGGGTHCDDIYAKCKSGQSSTIEYILAKSEA